MKPKEGESDSQQATMFRSTKGASKQRRDLINNEITVLRDLLPLPEAARQRLSQLQIMSLGCVYIRKCNFFAKFFGESESARDVQNFEFSQSMTGFMLVASREGKLLYISENVTEYLGHSMVDMMTQGDSIYDIIDKRDHSMVQTQLMQQQSQPEFEPSTALGAQTQPRDERAFFCRMNVARSFRRQAGFGDHKIMHVKGHFVESMLPDHYGNQPVFMALCSPLITPDVKETVVQNSTTTFYSVHSLDMKFSEIGHIGQDNFHLGYTEEELVGRSWYQFIHPEDIQEAKEKHNHLIKSSHEIGCMLTVRLQSKSGAWVWVNIVMHVRQPFVCDNGDPAIICINQVISENEAQMYKLQSQQYSSQIARGPELLGSQSPPQSISQVPVAGTSYQGYSGEQRSQEDITYQLLVSATTEPTSSIIQPPQSGDVPNAIVPATTTLADSKAHLKFSLEQKLAKDLKRKAGSPQHCKPNKMRRVEPEAMSPAEGRSIQTQAFISIFDGLGGGGLPTLGSGDLQVMSHVHDGPMYQMLHLKKEAVFKSQPLVIQVPDVKSQLCVKPPSPLTPDSITSEFHNESIIDFSKLQSTIDLTGLDTPISIAVPGFMLTPEASPASVTEEEVSMMSPDPQTDPTESQPALLPDPELLLFPETQRQKLTKPQLTQPTSTISMKLSSELDQWLPEMDSNVVTNFFNEIENSPPPAPEPVSLVPVGSPQHQTQDVVTVQPQQDLLAGLITPDSETQLLNQVTSVLRDIVEQATDAKLLSQLMAATDEMSAGLVPEQTASDADLFRSNDTTLTDVTSSTAADDVFNFPFEELLSAEFERSSLQFANDSDLPSSLFA